MAKEDLEAQELYNIKDMKSFLKFVSLSTIALLANHSIAQEKTIKKSIIDDACSCIAKINYNLSKNVKNDSIKSCITSSIVADQTRDYVEQIKKSIDTLKITAKDTVLNIGDNNIKIIVDKDYDEIQSQLITDCPELKALLDINNEEHEHSYSNKKKALEFYAEGEKYYNQNKYDLALVEYNKAVKADSKFAFAWDNMGVCYRKLERYKEAINCYQKSLELDPKGTMPLMNMAVAYNLLGDDSMAIQTYTKFIVLHPEDPEGFYGISRIQNATGDYANALENCLKAFQLYDNASSPYKQDALNVLREIVSNLKKDGKISIFNAFAEKYGLEKIKE